MSVRYYILLIYPVLLLAVFFAGAKIYRRGEYNEEFLSLKMSKHIQALAAFGIILHHLVQRISDYGDIDVGPVTILNSMGILFTSIFFFFSGFGLITSYLTKENYLEGFLNRRLVKVLIPFYLINLVYVPFAGIRNGRITDLYEFLISMFGFTLMNTNGWFIVEIVILYIVFYLIFKRTDNVKKGISLITLFCVLLVTLSLFAGHDRTRINGHWFMGEWWYNTTLMFPLGMVIASKKDKLLELLKKYYLILSLFFTAAFVIAFAYEEFVLKHIGYYTETYTYGGYPEKALTLLAQVILCAVFMMWIVTLSLKIKTGNKILAMASGISMEVYLAHGLIAYEYSSESRMPPVLIFAVVIAAGILMAVILKRVSVIFTEFMREYKSGKFENAETYERKQRYNMINKRVNAVKKSIVAMAVLTVILFVFNVYGVTIGRSNMIDEEINKISAAKVGNTVSFGRMNEEDIKWIIIEKNDDSALLITKYVIGGLAYNNRHASTTYEGSSIRKHLNEEGYYELFYKKERSFIKTCNSLGDKLYLLSPEEVAEYLKESDLRITNTNKKWNGANVSALNGNSWWWLRNDENKIKVDVISSTGNLETDREYVNVASGGVRPVIRVKLK